jgi:hypothetical protein
MAGLLGFGLAAQAQSSIVIAQWVFASDTNASTTASDVSASAMTHTGGSFDNGGRSGGGGINLDGSSYTGSEPIHDAVNDSGWTGNDGRYFARSFDDTSITSSTKHFAFDITLDPGVTYNLENVWFDFGIREQSGNQLSVQMSSDAAFTSPIVLGAGEDTDTANDALGYFDDGGTTSIGISNALPATPNAANTGNKNISWNRLDNDLNTPVTISGTTYFRIYVAGANGDNDPDNGNYIDNLTIEGSVVPEPSTYAALFGLMAFGFVTWRRRR